MAKKKRRSGKSMTRTAFKLIRLGALVAPAGIIVARADLPTVDMKVKEFLTIYTGFNAHTRKWEPQRMLEGWGGYLGAVLATYGIPKIAGIIRKL